MTLEAIIQRLSTINPVAITDVTVTGDLGAVGTMIDGKIVNELVIWEAGLVEQVQVIAAQIMRWGRLAAQAKRVWEIEERDYRIWRDGLTVSLAAVADEKKKPPQYLLEAQMRADPLYPIFQKKLERAEEAYNVAQAVLEGFRAKKDMLKSSVVRSQEDSAPRLSI
jgi:hypothetical protein